MRAARSAPVPAATTDLGERWAWALVAGLTAIGAALRLIGLDQQSLWNDELSSLVTANRPSLRHVFAQCAPDHVAGYYAILYVWMDAFGDSEAMLRLPSALFGIATIPAMFALGRRWYGAREGLIAAGITAVGWAPVYYSQEARPYALLLLATVVSMAWLCDIVRALRGGAAPSRLALVGYVAAAATATYTHHFGSLAVVLQAAMASVLLRRKPTALRALVAIYAAVAILYLPCVYRFVMYGGPRGIGWLSPPTPSDVWNLLRYYCNESDRLALVVVAAWALAALRSLLRRERPLPDTILLVVWLVLPVAISYVASHIVQPSFMPRVLIIVAPAAYLLLARALTQLPLTAISAPALWLVLLGHLVVGLEYYSRPTKAQFREAAAYLVAHDDPEAPGLVVACAWDLTYFDYYLEKYGSARRVAKLASTAADVAEAQALRAERNPREVWVLEGHRHCDPALLAPLVSDLTLVEEQGFLQAGVRHYRRGHE